MIQEWELIFFHIFNKSKLNAYYVPSLEWGHNGENDLCHQERHACDEISVVTEQGPLLLPGGGRRKHHKRGNAWSWVFSKESWQKKKVVMMGWGWEEMEEWENSRQRSSSCLSRHPISVSFEGSSSSCWSMLVFPSFWPDLFSFSSLFQDHSWLPLLFLVDDFWII